MADEDTQVEQTNSETPENVETQVTDTSQTEDVVTTPAPEHGDSETPTVPEVPETQPTITDATSNTTGLPAVQAPTVPNQPTPGVVSQDGPTAHNDLLKTGESIEGVLSHLNSSRSIHHDVTELEDILKSARQWLADELNVPVTIFGNAAALPTDSTDNAPATE